MIRISCPGCQKMLNVPDEKAGKTGKCPQCMTAFVIPEAPAATVNSTVEIAPCPKCQMALTVTADKLGTEVECPGCKTIFVAAKKTEAPPKPSSRVVTESSITRKKAVVDEDEEDERPSRRKRREAEEDEHEDNRPSKRRSDEDDEETENERKPKRRSKRDQDECPYCGETILYSAKKCKHCGEYLDEDLDDRRVNRSRRDRSSNTNQTTQIVIQNERARFNNERDGFNHTIHFVLDIVTCGAWLPVHLLCWILR